MRVVDDGREEIYGLDESKAFAQQIDAGVVVGIESNEHVWIGLARQFTQHGVERCWIEFCGAARGFRHRREFYLFRQIPSWCIRIIRMLARKCS